MDNNQYPHDLVDMHCFAVTMWLGGKIVSECNHNSKGDLTTGLQPMCWQHERKIEDFLLALSKQPQANRDLDNRLDLRDAIRHGREPPCLLRSPRGTKTGSGRSTARAKSSGVSPARPYADSLIKAMALIETWRKQQLHA